LNRVFRRGKGTVVPDGTRVYPYLNPLDSTSGLPAGLFGGASVALGVIRPRQRSKIQMHPLVTVIFWVVRGRLRIKTKSYVLNLDAEDGAVARPGTYLQLINPSARECRVLYIVTPPYVFLKRRGRIIYDDAVVFGDDWDDLPPRPRPLSELRRARKKALAALR
jgi:hypothetical protein